MSGTLAAVDVQDFPADERCALQVHDRVNDVVDLADRPLGEYAGPPHATVIGRGRKADALAILDQCEAERSRSAPKTSLWSRLPW